MYDQVFTRALPPANGVSRRRKAAMIVQLALAEGAPLRLDSLPEDLQLELTRELGAIRLVDRATLSAVAEEFLAGLESVGLALPGGMDHAIDLLSERLSPSARDRARREAMVGRQTDRWPDVLALDFPVLLSLVERESTEVSAILLSKLPVAKAADLLGKMPGERARRITYAVSQTAGISPAAVDRIGRALAQDYAERPRTAFDKPPVQRVGAILNSSPAATRDAVLAALTDDDKPFAEAVRKAIFTFADIPDRLRALDVPAVTRAMDQADLITALAAARASDGAEAAAVDYILANMSQRMADALRDEIGQKGKIRPSEAERCWAAVVATIRAKAEAGEISLATKDEEED